MSILSEIQFMCFEIYWQKKPKYMPNFIFSIIKRNQLKKIKKIINKIDNINEPLSTTNVLEYFMKISNFYIPNGEFRNTKWVKVNSNIYKEILEMGTHYTLEMKSHYIIDDISYKIEINDTDYMHINIIAKNNDNIETFDVSIKSLKSSNKKYGKYINMLNKNILIDMKYFLLECIIEDV